MHSETCTLLFCTFSCLHVPAPLTHPCREALDVISRREQHQRAPAARVSQKQECPAQDPSLAALSFLSCAQEKLPVNSCLENSSAQLSSPQLSLAAPSACSPLLGQGSASQNHLPRGAGKAKTKNKTSPPFPFPGLVGKGCHGLTLHKGPES